MCLDMGMPSCAILALVVAAVFFPAAAACAATTAVRHEFLFDSHVVRESENLRRRQVVARRFDKNPILQPQYPWEKNTAKGTPFHRMSHPVVLADRAAGLLRLLYWCYAMRTKEQFVCAAESKDGHTWKRTLRTKYAYGSAKRTNIVITVRDLPQYGAVSGIWPVENPQPELLPNSRYIAITVLHRPDTCLITSPDGLNWDLQNRVVMLTRKNDCHVCLTVGADGRFLAFVRRHLGKRGLAHRAVDVMTSRDLKNWSKPRLVLKTEPKPGEIVPSDQPYSMPVVRLDGAYVCLLPMLHVTRRTGKYNTDVGPMDIELVTSRTGLRWDWPFRGEPILPIGGEGQWDAKMVYSNSGIFEWRGKWLVIYAGGPSPHGRGSPLLLGGAEFDRGRLIAVRQQDRRRAAWLVTRPQAAGGGTLLVNADPAGGGIRVAVLDAHGKELPGYAAKSSRLTKFDKLRYRATWPTKTALPAAGRCRIRIELTNGAALHAYEIIPVD